MNILIVDGYNMIGAWPRLKQLSEKDFDQARRELLEKMAEYGAYTGKKVIVVFDAHLAPGRETKVFYRGVEVIYTKEKETADERIEKLAITLSKDDRHQVYVATSDYTEQWAVFGRGALRLSARDLLRELNSMTAEISQQIEDQRHREKKGKIQFSRETLELFEKIRRGEK